MNIENKDKIIEGLKSALKVQAEKLSRCENLLSEAHDLMDDVHCYDTEIYHEISRYFEGE